MAAAPQAIKRSFRLWPWLVGTVGFIAGAVTMALPPVSSAISHLFDRVRYGADKSYELKVRTDFYRQQIAKQLGISPDQVGVKEFEAAAQINPLLNSAYNEVIRKESRENRESLLINGATAFVPGGAAVKDMMSGVRLAQQAGHAIAGMGVSALFNREIVSSHDVLEALSNDMLKAQSEGKDLRAVVTPRSIFMLRVAQDDVLNAEIKKRFGKSFHKLSETEQQGVMAQYPALSNAAASEAYAVATGILPLQELMASAPNLQASASRYAAAPAGGFAARVQAEREAAAVQAAAGQKV